MLEEGMDFYETPLEMWLSHSLHMVHKRGGKAIALSQYEEEERQSIDELMEKIDKVNNDKPWQ